MTLFGPGGATPRLNATFHTNADGGHDLLDSLHNGTTSFTNAGPNEIMSMLGQVAGFFTSIAGQGILAQQIPFTTITLGQALDYAKEFKHNFIDPLFKSGDSTKPDANGDGKVDFQDFNFSSVQDLLNRLTNALGLGSPLVSTYDPSSNTLSFQFQPRQDARHRHQRGDRVKRRRGRRQRAPRRRYAVPACGRGQHLHDQLQGRRRERADQLHRRRGDGQAGDPGLAGIPSATDVKCEAPPAAPMPRAASVARSSCSSTMARLRS